MGLWKMIARMIIEESVRRRDTMHLLRGLEESIHFMDL